MNDELKLLAEFSNNATLLLSLTILYQLFISHQDNNKLLVQVASGLLFGLVVIIGMSLPVHLMPGVIFDARSVILSLGGLFGGPVTALIAAGIAALYRAWLGGSGTLVGILIILTSSAAGVTGFYLRKSKRWSVKGISFLAFGFIVHVLSFLWLSLLPPDIRWQVIQQVSLPFLVVLPTATFLAGMIMLLVEKRFEAEKKLRESERLFRTIFEQAAVGVALIDSNSGRVLRINKYYCDLLGYSVEELSSVNAFMKITHDDDIAADKRDMERLLAAEIHDFKMAKRYFHKNGSTVWVNLSVSSTASEGEKPTTHIAVVEDYTRRKKAELKLVESEQRQRLFIEHAPAALAMFDHEMHYLAVSQRWVTDYSLADSNDMLGKSHYDIFPEIPERWKAIHRRGLEGEVISADEDRFEREDGSIQWIRWEVRPWFNSEDKVGGIVIFTEDITELKKSDLALREKEKLYMALFEYMPLGMLITDQKGYYTDANPGMCHMMGYSHEEFIGLHATDIVASTETKFIDPGLDIIINTSNYKRVWKLRRKDGSEFDAEISATKLPDDLILAVIQDITEVKLSERALRESESRMRTLVETIPDMVWLKNTEGDYLYCNQKFERFFGAKEAQIIGKSDYDFVDRERADFFRENDQAAMASNRPTINEEEVTFADDGHHEYLETIKTPVFSANNETIGVLGISRDISQRKRAELELIKLAQAVEQSPVSIVITNLDAEIEYVNQAFVQFSGYSREEVLGQNPRILQSARSQTQNYESMRHDLLEGKTWKGKLCNRKKDGTEYLELAIITPIRQPDGSITHYVAVKEDITEKKLLGDELEKHRHHLEELVEQRTRQLAVATEHAESANRAKSSFLANMSHEIRTPMNAIIGLTHILQRDEKNTTNADRLNKIDAAGRHLLAIINDILDLSKIESGKLVLEHTDFHLGAIFIMLPLFLKNRPKIKDWR